MNQNKQMDNSNSGEVMSWTEARELGIDAVPDDGHDEADE